ncbi:MAG: hypothetical protein LC749_11040, partial [Actinobacteria bacterium]|nr:hypothetical protein [Actinomycetota bacterium]
RIDGKPRSLTTAPPATPGRTRPTMTTPTYTETASADVVRVALVKSATFQRCSIWRHVAENLAESGAGLRLHPLGNATGSRDAP